MLLSVGLVAYLAYVSSSGRLNNVLLALGLTAQALTMFMQPSRTRTATALIGFVLIAMSLVMVVRLLFPRQRRQQ